MHLVNDEGKKHCTVRMTQNTKICCVATVQNYWCY